MKRFLGIDYGSKRIGVAISDETNAFAFPHGVLKNDARALREIQKICDGEKITDIVIGSSTNYKGEDNPIMERIRTFAEALGEASAANIHFEPEFLTSAQAERLQGKNDLLDASAAALILKSFLEKYIS